MLNQSRQYDAFYGAVLSCTLLSNDGSDAWRRDSASILSLLCRAYGYGAQVEAEWRQLILTDMLRLSLLGEREAAYSRRAMTRRYDEHDLVLDIKGDALIEISSKFADGRHLSPTWFDYSHIHVYHPVIRYAQIGQAASVGWLLAARQLGMMLALGIGCEVDLEAAKRKFLQCVYWCDLPGAYLLSYLYRQEGDTENARVYADLAELLACYLHDGITVIPEADVVRFHPRALVLYAQVSSIYRDVCCAYNHEDIDYSFVEVMMAPDLDDNAKMEYINNYDRKEWKNVSNPITYRNGIIGFNGGHHE